MAEALHLPINASKEDIYESLLPQIRSVISGETNLIANLANISSMLKMAFDHFWVGFYLLEGKSLVLGPFQGPLACTRIPVYPKPRGVCGTSAYEQKTLLIEDVEQFSGHIACSSETRSEIVIPLVIDSHTELVLDIDSKELNHFDLIDKKYCEKIVQLIEELCFN
ncbi:GAF domain-containing protein [Marinoscillum sp.]|uniref:GAF domain-containing protein n=1 Tax=Marinoscillum sp. TaxID=2024838 RepID=UPI003BAADBEF